MALPYIKGQGGGGGGGSLKIVIQDPNNYQHKYKLENGIPKYLTSTLARMVCVVAMVQYWSICNY